MKILHDLVLIKPAEEKESPLCLPDASKQMPQEGEVIEVGPEVLNINIGDRVVFRKWVGDLVELHDVPYVATKAEDILLVLEKDE